MVLAAAAPVCHTTLRHNLGSIMFSTFGGGVNTCPCGRTQIHGQAYIRSYDTVINITGNDKYGYVHNIYRGYLSSYAKRDVAY